MMKVEDWNKKQACLASNEIPLETRLIIRYNWLLQMQKLIPKNPELIIHVK